MNRPKLLDLFCGPGGASAGYVRAGFEVMGVDTDPKTQYPYRFINADALSLTARFIRTFDAVHASPPCNEWSELNKYIKRDYIDLIGPTRAMLDSVGVPYVIENVPKAPLIDPVMLCGQMFGLRVLRHRLFESTAVINQLAHVPHTDYIPFATPNDDTWSSERAFADAMGLTWCNARNARRAIPPAYTEYIGRELLCQLNG